MPHPTDVRFPKAIQELWATLLVEVVWLHGRWIIYRQLFGTSKKRIELLNETAGTVTWVLQNLLLHDVQMALSKIGDSAGSGKRKNLTLRRLQVELHGIGESSVADGMENLLNSFETSCDKVRHRRNKWIAHNDLDTLLNARAIPLEGPSRDEIENSMEKLRDVMNLVELHYTQTTRAYEHFVMKQDGEHLIAALTRAKRYRELVATGDIPRDDLRKAYPSGV